MKRVIIVDDEQAAINKLERMLKSADVQVVGKFINPKQVPAFFKKTQADMVFLDIEMPKVSGLELANQLMDIQHDIRVVFVTAYSEYAVDAFKCNAIDYLLKPVEKDRLAIALSRIPDSPPGKKDHSAHIEIRCFGKFEVLIDDKPLKFRTAKAEELFAYLINANGRPVNRDHIIDLFWEDYDGDRALILFNTTLHYLKKAFFQSGVNLKITYQRGTYTLEMNDIDCDAVRFEREAGKSLKITPNNVGKFEKASVLYSGDYFEQNDFTWSEQKKIFLKEKYIRLMIAIAKYYISEHKMQRAIELMKTALVQDPVNRNLNLLLLKALKANSDSVSMKNYYQIYQKKISEEYGLEPDTEFLKVVGN